MDHNANYYHWLTNANAEIVEELRSYSEKDIEDSFYKSVLWYRWSAWHHWCRH